MKQVRSVIDLAKYQQLVQKDLEKEIGTSIRDNIGKLSKTYHTTHKKWYLWVNLIVFLSAFLPLIIIVAIGASHATSTGFGFLVALIVIAVAMFLIKNRARSKAQQLLIKEINHNKIYEIIFMHLPNITYGGQSNVKTNDLMKYRIGGIPSDARIVTESPTISFKLNQDMIGHVQTGLARWTRSNGKTRNTYYRGTAYISLASTKQLETALDYYLRPKSIINNSKQYDLESREFNKKFYLTFNDAVKIRMLYTPYAMEETIKHAARIWTKTWDVTKTANNYLFRFSPNGRKQLLINGKIYPHDINRTINSFVNDIIMDGYNFYLILFLILIPPLI